MAPDALSCLPQKKQGNNMRQLRNRIDLLIGTTRWQTALAEGLGRARPVVAGWFTDAETTADRLPPDYLVAIIELLEMTPVNKWPSRWSKLSKLKTANDSKQS